jgi:lysophospholipase L1-like esterase
MDIHPNSKLIFIGDSITDYERTRPVGEGLFEALGKGYVSLVDGFLTVRYPERRIRSVNMGINGNTVRDLQARWQTDVLDLKPDWLSILIGINDVWRQFDTPLISESLVALDEYRQTLDEVLGMTRPSLKGLILMTPFVFETNRNDAMRVRMDEYGAVVKQMAGKYQAILVDTQAAFDEIMKYYHPTALGWDRIHPMNRIGHVVIARAFLQAVGYEWA